MSRLPTHIPNYTEVLEIWSPTAGKVVSMEKKNKCGRRGDLYKFRCGGQPSTTARHSYDFGPNPVFGSEK